MGTALEVTRGEGKSYVLISKSETNSKHEAGNSKRGSCKDGKWKAGNGLKTVDGVLISFSVFVEFFSFFGSFEIVKVRASAFPDWFYVVGLDDSF